MARLIAALICASMLSGCWFWADGNYSSYGQRNGMFIASYDVDNSCVSPRLRTAIDSFERHFGRKIVVSSQYRDPIRNIIAGGQDSSYHMQCMAVDFFMPGIDKRSLIGFAMGNDQVGGLGCYPGHVFIHIDVRDRPRGYRKPVTFSGC